MVGLAILNSSANAARMVPEVSCAVAEHPACAPATPPPRRADAKPIRKPPDFMTAAPKPTSAQEGFFWKTKTLEEMSSAEWESLCDGCARCCLEKLEDEDTGKIYFTHVS